MAECSWAHQSPELQVYHDHIWGKPVTDEQQLFKRLCLETYQAGLSWQTVLNKQAAFAEDFHDFELVKVAAMTTKELEQILQDPRIIRNRLKIAATVNNAQAVLRLDSEGEFSSLSTYLWHFVDGQPLIAYPMTEQEVPSTSPLAQQIARDLKRRGFKFVGPTIVYSWLQAVGIVNDHLVGCPAK
ncbi:DNA-3-methyladenine glycosylase I [Lapidilactobacillus luobeiensis]|uniref:DNA-3-methyladenine glycosylase I n=1 Tax=Lapidilactobacillus luobeiensis TaxID=2950371 RepID=UPI0021C38976|nr:DNA-3-methyladenine glycosylase I [Lapidilactobacillus luobeiensis]